MTTLNYHIFYNWINFLNKNLNYCWFLKSKFFILINFKFCLHNNFMKNYHDFLSLNFMY